MNNRKKLIIGLAALLMFWMSSWTEDIHQAAMQGDPADVNAKDYGGDTPIHVASYSGHKDMVELLIAKGAELEIKHNMGRTRLDKSSRLGHKEIVELFRAKGAEGNVDKPGNLRKITGTDRTDEAQKNPVKFTILYDNYVFKEGTKEDWGFSCLIEGTEKTILFDTGTRSEILMHNIKQLNVDLNQVEQIVISHNHGDHTGGLSAVLDENHNVSVYLPVSFPHGFVRNVENKKATVISVDKPVKICQNVFLTGEMGVRIKEQSLIVNTSKGLIIVTGCSHQGIINILKRAKEMFNKQIYLVFGGFHLGGTPDSELQEIIRNFKEMGVLKCGPTHCTGDKAIGLFKKAYGENYVQMGTGRVLVISN